MKNSILIQKSAGWNHKIQAAIPYVVLVAAVSAAWFPIVGGKPLVGDEYPFTLILKNGLGNHLAYWLSTWGVLRLLGQVINGLNTNYPASSSYLTLFTHALTVCLFFRVSQLLLKRTNLSLVLALIMGVFPWGYQSLVQIMGYTTMLSATLFLAHLLLLLKFSQDRQKQYPVFLLSFLITFIAQTIYENLVFSFMISGLILWIDEDKIRWKTILSRSRQSISGFAPFLGGLTFLVLYKLTTNSGEMSKTLGRSLSANPEAILSVYFYQYTNAHVFQPWFSSDTRNLIFFSWNFTHVLAFICLLSLFLASLAIFLNLKEAESARSAPGNGLLIYIVLLLLGASFLYAAAGGYSIDTRKKYALVPLMLLFLGWIWCRFFELHVYRSRKVLALLLAIGLFGMSTTWLVTSVYRYDLLRQDALSTFLAKENIAGNIQIELEPDVRKAWPTMASTLGFDLYADWAVNIALRAKRDRLCCKTLINIDWILQDPGAVYIGRNSDAPKLRFDTEFPDWRIVR